MQLIEVNGFQLKSCELRSEFDQVAALRYTAYRSVDAIAENPSSRFIDPYDFLPNTKSCLVYENELPVASVRSCVYAPDLGYLRIPAMDAYKEDIKAACGLDKVMVESNRFVTLPEKADSKVLFKIPFRFIILNLLKFQGDFILTAVREKHIPLYKRFLTMEPISKPKLYPGINAEMVLMCGDCKLNLQNVINKEEFFSITQEEIEAFSIVKSYDLSKIEI